MPQESKVGVVRHERGPIQATPEDREKAQRARQEARAAWKPVRQPAFEADRTYLKAILVARGVSRIPEQEPASHRRLRQLLRRAGLTQVEAEEAVGCKLPRLIALNPDQALWWLTATTLEAAGVTADPVSQPE